MKKVFQYNNFLFDLMVIHMRFYDLSMQRIFQETSTRAKELSMEKDGMIIPREKGTPQGGVISPLLANLFLHYVFDLWMAKHHPSAPIVRYADYGIVHCRTKEEAEKVKNRLERRFGEVGLEIHPDKTHMDDH